MVVSIFQCPTLVCSFFRILGDSIRPSLCETNYSCANTHYTLTAYSRTTGRVRNHLISFSFLHFSSLSNPYSPMAEIVSGWPTTVAAISHTVETKQWMNKNIILYISLLNLLSVSVIEMCDAYRSRWWSTHMVSSQRRVWFQGRPVWLDSLNDPKSEWLSACTQYVTPSSCTIVQ